MELWCAVYANRSATCPACPESSHEWLCVPLQGWAYYSNFTPRYARSRSSCATPKIPLCHFIIAVIVDVHNHYRRYLAAVPSMVTPSFAEAVAGDVTGCTYSSGSIADDPPSLGAGDWAVCAVAAGENVAALPVWEVNAEGLYCLFV